MRFAIRILLVSALIVGFTRSACGQSNTSAILSNTMPETAFISVQKYTNAFFGYLPDATARGPI